MVLARRILAAGQLIRSRPPGAVGPLHCGGHAGDSAWFAYGSAPGQDTVTIVSGGRTRQVPAGSNGVRAFTGIRAGPRRA